MSTNNYHRPVLLSECIEGLNINPKGVYVDMTFGGGGYSREILKKLDSDGRLYAFDIDEDAMKNSIDDDRFCLIGTNYRYFLKELRLRRVLHVDGIVADLGISSHQIDDMERGFSFMTQMPLDMRMGKSVSMTAADVVNNYSQTELADVFFSYGEVSCAKQVAREVVKRRGEQPIKTADEMCEVIKKFTKPNIQNKFFAKIFQALRIEVNDEMHALEEMLCDSMQALNIGGRLCVVSYHSLEDSRVKNLMRSGKIDGEIEKDFYGNALTPFKIINKKPITPSEQELHNNPRSRSAKLRIAEKIDMDSNWE